MALRKCSLEYLGRLCYNNAVSVSRTVHSTRQHSSLAGVSEEGKESACEGRNAKSLEEVTNGTDFQPKKTCAVPPELRLVLPDFMPEPDFKRRNPIAEKLERMDMIRRRVVLEIPEFYVGSILAVTVSDEFSPKCTNRFVGICISRDDRGLRHHVTLRNVVDGIGVEVRYNIYNPLIQKIQVLKLEKRLDEELLYLRDALPEYSTIPFNMEPVVLAPGSLVPTNPIKVKLKPHPWTKKWEHHSFKGIDEFWHHALPQWKKRLTKTHFEPWRKYDIVDQYKRSITRDEQRVIYEELKAHDREQTSVSHGRRAPILSQLRSQKTTVSS